MSMLNVNNSRAVSSVVTLYEAFGQIKLLEAMFSSLDREFQKMGNPITGKHSICCEGTDPVKTDSVKAYVAMCIKFNFNAHGNYLSAFSKESIAHFEQRAVDSVINRVACTSYTTHDEVFITVMSMLLGYDPMLLKAALTKDDVKKCENVYRYVAGRYGFEEGYQPYEETIDTEVNGEIVKKVIHTHSALDVYIEDYLSSEVFKKPLTEEQFDKLLKEAFETQIEFDFNLLEAICRIC